MENIVNIGVQAALVVLVMLLVPCTYRVWVGPTPTERLQAIDSITTLLIGIIIVLALVQGSSFVIDVGIALAAFGFIGTLATARYLCEGRVF